MSLTSVKNSRRAHEHVLPILRRFCDIPAAEWRYAAGLLELRRLAAGATLTRAGEVAHHFGFVVSGLIRKLHVSERGKPVVRDFGGPGAIVGAYVSLLTRERSYLTVEALAPSELFVLEWQKLELLYARHPCWQTLGRRIAERFVVEREQRAHELLTLTAAERYTAFCAAHQAVLPQLRAYDIASYLGITPVAFSRLKARELSARARMRNVNGGSARLSSG